MPGPGTRDATRGLLAIVGLVVGSLYLWKTGGNYLVPLLALLALLAAVGILCLGAFLVSRRKG
jgi:hypothetical protein